MKVVFGQEYMPLWPVDITDAGSPARKFAKWAKSTQTDFLFNVTADPGEVRTESNACLCAQEE